MLHNWFCGAYRRCHLDGQVALSAQVASPITDQREATVKAVVHPETRKHSWELRNFDVSEGCHLYQQYPLAVRTSARMETLRSVKMLPLKRWFQATDGSIAWEPIRMQPESKWASRLWRHSRWEMPHGVCKEHRGGFLLSRYSMRKKVLSRREQQTHFSISYAPRKREDAQYKSFSTMSDQREKGFVCFRV